MKFGTAYFGCTHSRHFTKDFKSLRDAGLTFIVLPFSESDLWFSEKNVAQQIEKARLSGIETWLDPWGVLGIFGGESFSYFVARYPETTQKTPDGNSLPAACPNHPATREYLDRWVEKVSALSPDGIFWDEPHFFQKTWHPENVHMPACFCNRCDAEARTKYDRSVRDLPPDSLTAFQSQSLLGLILPLLKKTRASGLKAAVCLIPEELGGSAYLSQNPDLFGKSVDILSYDPYYHMIPADEKAKRAFVKKYIDRMAFAKDRWGVSTWLWLPGFLLPEGGEALFPWIVKEARASETDYLSLWAYRGTQMMSGRACENPERVWRNFLRLVAGKPSPR